uniref:Uncharacterized protein n=1 Tax=Myotis myotis TaxID=51298 RepID=A0A7J7SRI1_MYOMY|nr:hypothetical protein mMyoMyo1_009351 [Myotis myotis]
MPHENMPLGRKDYLELSAAEAEQTQEELSALPVCLQAEHNSQGKVSFLHSPAGRGEQPYHRRLEDRTSSQTRLRERLPSISFSHYLPSLLSLKAYTLVLLYSHFSIKLLFFSKRLYKLQVLTTPLSYSSPSPPTYSVPCVC